MISVWKRLKFAWAAFKLRKTELVIRPYEYGGELRTGVKCDNNPSWRTGCPNKADGGYYSRSVAKLIIDLNDEYFLCKPCAVRVKGKWINMKHVVEQEAEKAGHGIHSGIHSIPYTIAPRKG